MMGKSVKQLISRVVAISMCVSVLGGCVDHSLSSEQLRANPVQKGTLSFAGSYPVIFANMTASANQCFPTKPLGYGPGYLVATAAGSITTKSTELQSGKLAKVESMFIDGFSGAESVFLSMDIRAVPSGTEVDFFISRRFFASSDMTRYSFVPIANAWAQRDGTKCD